MAVGSPGGLALPESRKSLWRNKDTFGAGILWTSPNLPVTITTNAGRPGNQASFSESRVS